MSIMDQYKIRLSNMNSREIEYELQKRIQEYRNLSLEDTFENDEIHNRIAAIKDELKKRKNSKR